MRMSRRIPYIGGRYLLWLELQTDEGIKGLGERITGSTYSRRLGDLKSQISLIEEMVRQYVIGENPFNIEKIWDRMYALAARLPASRACTRLQC